MYSVFYPSSCTCVIISTTNIIALGTLSWFLPPAAAATAGKRLYVPRTKTISVLIVTPLNKVALPTATREILTAQREGGRGRGGGKDRGRKREGGEEDKRKRLEVVYCCN